jgi:Domain of unknown function (DUF5911)
MTTTATKDRARSADSERRARAPAAVARPRSAAAPSPFPPIADYAFLSDCHTSALVAPDGAIDWLCVPRFDAPSVFGALLDREAGFFRFAPFGIHRPATRIYEPGTNTLVTTWQTRGGWVIVRDALTIGPRHREDEVTPHTRPPADDDAEHMLVRTVVCLDGSVELELVCEPVFDYGRVLAQWTLLDADRHVADASGADETIRLRTDFAVGVEGGRARARHTLAQGEQAYCSLSWAEGLASPANVDEAKRPAGRDDALLARVARRGARARPPLARADPALGAGDQGPHVHADGGDGGGCAPTAASRSCMGSTGAATSARRRARISPAMRARARSASATARSTRGSGRRAAPRATTSPPS